MKTLLGGLLCLCVFMSVLGAPTTLWSMTAVSDAMEENVLEESVFEANSIPSASIPVVVRQSGDRPADVCHVLADRLMDGGLFRPPCFG